MLKRPFVGFESRQQFSVQNQGIISWNTQVYIFIILFGIWVYSLHLRGKFYFHYLITFQFNSYSTAKTYDYENKYKNLVISAILLVSVFLLSYSDQIEKKLIGEWSDDRKNETLIFNQDGSAVSIFQVMDNEKKLIKLINLNGKLIVVKIRSIQILYIVTKMKNQKKIQRIFFPVSFDF